MVYQIDFNCLPIKCRIKMMCALKYWTKRGETGVIREERRDSFSHRINEELCVFILSYLSFEDKIRLECVSKEFQKCVYRKQFGITFRYFNNHLYEYDPDKINLFPYHRTQRPIAYDYNYFERLLKKCDSIRRIALYTAFKSGIRNTILDIIIKNCKKLDQIVFNFDGIHPILKQNFIDKFQRQLRVCAVPFIITYNEPHIDDRSLGFHSEFLSLCPKVEEIDLIFYHNFNEKLDLTSNRLKKFKFNSTAVQAAVQSIIVSNKESLKCIEFMIRDQDRGQAIRLLPTLSRVKNLERLALLFRAYYEDEFEFIPGTEQVQLVHMDQTNDPIENFLTDTISGLTDIGLLCCRLKHFHLKIHLFKSSECSQVFETMCIFTRLTRLDLNMFAGVTDTLYSYYCGWLKDCHNLTQVSLNLQIDGLNPEIYSFGDFFFNRIDENLPKLQNLCVSYPILTVEGLTSLSKLTQLRKVMINTNKFWGPGCFYKTYDIIKNNPKLEAFKMTQPIDLSVNLVFDLEQYFTDVRGE